MRKHSRIPESRAQSPHLIYYVSDLQRVQEQGLSLVLFCVSRKSTGCSPPCRLEMLLRP